MDVCHDPRQGNLSRNLGSHMVILVWRLLMTEWSSHTSCCLWRLLCALPWQEKQCAVGEDIINNDFFLLNCIMSYWQIEPLKDLWIQPRQFNVVVLIANVTLHKSVCAFSFYIMARGVFCALFSGAPREPCTDSFWMGRKTFYAHITHYCSPNIL